MIEYSWIDTVVEHVNINGETLRYVANGTISVPKDIMNKKYVDIMDWSKNGGIIERDKTDEELTNEDFIKKMKSLEKSMWIHLDYICNSQGFVGDDLTRPYRALGNYVGGDTKYAETARALVAWTVACFDVAENTRNKVINGEMSIPSEEAFISSLPQYGG